MPNQSWISYHMDYKDQWLPHKLYVSSLDTSEESYAYLPCSFTCVSILHESQTNEWLGWSVNGYYIAQLSSLIFGRVLLVSRGLFAPKLHMYWSPAGLHRTKNMKKLNHYFIMGEQAFIISPTQLSVMSRWRKESYTVLASQRGSRMDELKVKRFIKVWVF